MFAIASLAAVRHWEAANRNPANEASGGAIVIFILALGYVALRRRRESVSTLSAQTADLTRANEALRSAIESEREAQRRLQLIFESNPMPTWLVDDVTMEFLDVNDAALRAYGYSREEFRKMRITDIRPPEDVAATMQFWSDHANDTSFGRETRHRRKDGRLMDVLIKVNRFECGGRKTTLAVAYDITEHRSLEHQLRQSQKMDAIGRLAGGVAHDFNNLLGVILGYSQILEGELALNSRQREMFDEVISATRRASGLTQQLLTFSRKQKMQFRPIDLNDTIAELAKMLERIIGEDIALSLELTPASAPVNADPGMISQVLVNLAVNARDAMPKGGRLEVTTERVSVREEARQRNLQARPGEFVCIGVRDTGSGIAPEVLPHIFEPFFTTKDVGRGTGLGLSTVLGVVEQHRGWIDVETEAGQGTQFRIYLPLHVAKAPASNPSRLPDFAPPGSESLLLVEDDSTLRGLEVAVLEKLGYRVHQACAGPAALEIWHQHRHDIQLLITDLVMPDGLNGVDLARTLRTERPDLSVIVTSGYIGGGWDQAWSERDKFRFLPKPFDIQTLAKMARESLDGTAAVHPGGS